MFGREKMVMKSALPWKNINAPGKNKAIQSAYVFFVLVPIIVKLYTTAKAVPLFKFDLPFSWVALFFAALTVSAANTVCFIFHSLTNQILPTLSLQNWASFAAAR